MGYLNLTKERAIEEHRAMWRWIADRYLEGITVDVASLKMDYLLNGYGTNGYKVRNQCFCCDYGLDSFSNRPCIDCPFKWTNEDDNIYDCEKPNSPYQILFNHGIKFEVTEDEKEREELFKKLYDAAIQIAELPLKEQI